MSEIAEAFPPRGFPRKYPWELWSDGRIHILKRGTHFDSTPRLFVHAAYNHGERHGFRVTTCIQGSDVLLRFLPKRGER